MKKHNLIFTILLAVMMAFTACTEDENDSYTETGSITIISPANGDNWQIGTEQVIRWSDDLTENVMIHLYQGNSLIQPINTSASGTEYTWTVPTHLPTGTDYKIRIGSTITAEIYDESDYFEISDYGRSDFAAKWIVESGNNKVNIKSEDTFSSGLIYPNKIENTKGDPNLAKNIPDGWSDNIILNTSHEIYSDLQNINPNDDLYVMFSFTNNGSGSTETPFVVDLYFDDYKIWSVTIEDNVQPGGWFWYYYGFINLAEGTHEIKVILDSENQVDESNEIDNEFTKTYTVSGPSAIYESFEFVESRYFITKTDGSFVVGALTANNNELTLSGFGTISIISIDDNNISFDLTLDKKTTTSTINAYKSEEVVSTTMTDMLTLDQWVLTGSSHLTPDIGGIWSFLKSSTYWFEYSNGTRYKKGWEYVDETTIHYGSYGGPYNGTATIDQITNTYLKILDENYYYEFER